MLDRPRMLGYPISMRLPLCLVSHAKKMYCVFQSSCCLLSSGNHLNNIFCQQCCARNLCSTLECSLAWIGAFIPGWWFTIRDHNTLSFVSSSCLTPAFPNLSISSYNHIDPAFPPENFIMLHKTFASEPMKGTPRYSTSTPQNLHPSPLCVFITLSNTS